MATVFLGSLQGAHGFRQLVAIKRPHPHLLEDQGFRDALLREARLAASIHHANVVDVRDVESVGDAVQLVMDYIEGASLGELVGTQARAGKRLPPGIAVRIVLDACAGLHAAHEAVDDGGEPVGLVHRDVSPQNVLVGVDGIARVTDFGIAKCIESSDPGTSRETLKGKAGYMAPEYVRGKTVDRRADVFALGVVLWEALCGKRLFRGQSDAETLERVLSPTPAPPVSEAAPEIAVFDAVVARALAKDVAGRFATTEEMAGAVSEVATAHGMVASAPDVGRFVREVVGDRLEERRRALRAARPGLESTPPPRLVLVAPSDPGNESTTVPERPAAPARRARVALLAGVLLLAGSGVLVVIVQRRVASTAPPVAAVQAAPAAPSATPVSSVAPVATEQPAPPPATSGDAPPRSRPSGHGPSRPAGRQPPPNPYPTGP
jgi:hypothetical protein